MSLYDAVELEQAAFTQALRDSPEAALVRQLAELFDAERDPRAASAVARELRAALDAQREAVARAGKRGDAIDEIGAKRAARRAGTTPADPGSAAEH